MGVCAVCQNQTGLVINMIVADANVDSPPEGCFLVNVEEGTSVGFAWAWDGTKFVDPSKIQSITIATDPNQQA